MRAALGGDEGVNLIDDSCVNAAKSLCRLRGEHEIERFRRGDENVSGMTAEFCALAGWSVSCAYGDGRLVEWDAGIACGLSDSRKGRAKITLDIDGEGFKWRDVKDAGAFGATLQLRMQH